MAENKELRKEQENRRIGYDIFSNYRNAVIQQVHRFKKGPP